MGTCLVFQGLESMRWPTNLRFPMDPLIPSICQQQEISAAPCLKELFFNEVWRVKIPQHGMTRYVNWTEEMAYGRAVPLGHKMANFADPDWGNCRFDTNTLRKGRGYKHALIKNYTTRWNNVLRHDIGHSGKSTRCDELGWVSIEEFIRNDHAWPRDDPSAYNHSTRSYKEEVLHSRRRLPSILTTCYPRVFPPFFTPRHVWLHQRPGASKVSDLKLFFAPKMECGSIATTGVFEQALKELLFP